MTGDPKSAMQCPEFEALLTEALDNQLNGAENERFQAHRAECAACGAMYAEAETGFRLLHSLAEAEPPADFVHNIMMATAGVTEVEGAPVKPPSEGWWDSVRNWAPRIVAPVLQPRFAMSFGMAFFSLSVLLNVAGIKLADLRYVDLRPSTLVRYYYETSGRLVKYYENIRFVYEIESRVQRLKQATSPDENSQPDKNKNQDKNDNKKSGEPDKKISREEGQAVLAGNHGRDLRPEFASTARRTS